MAVAAILPDDGTVEGADVWEVFSHALEAIPGRCTTTALGELSTEAPSAATHQAPIMLASGEHVTSTVATGAIYFFGLCRMLSRNWRTVAPLSSAGVRLPVSQLVSAVAFSSLDSQAGTICHLELTSHQVTRAKLGRAGPGNVVPLDKEPAPLPRGSSSPSTSPL